MTLPSLSVTAVRFVLTSFLAAAAGATAVAGEKPNIVILYGDDVGYGDLSCYGAKAVQTPNCDRAAREGLRFTSGYAAASTCTPSRFTILSGEYAFRRSGTGVLPGDAALIIPLDKPSLPSILKAAGYATAAVGKWHLGLGSGNHPLDWNAEIRPSANDVGFDYAFIMPATGDRVPCVFIENRRVANLDPADPIQVDYKKPFPGEPDGITNRSQLRMDWSFGHNNAVINGVGRIGFMTGGKKALWNDEQISTVLASKATHFIEENKDHPFFLYYATHNIHVPRLPGPQFVGKTTMGPRGDSIVEFDWQVGEVLNTLDRLGLSEKTLVIISSDNGPIVDDGYKDDALEKMGAHRPAGPWRGGKYTIYEGGTRMPFIVRWPGRVKPGTSDAIVSQVDFCATFAALTGQSIPEGGAPDSRNILPALLGDSRTGRDDVLEYSQNGAIVAIRAGDWKFIPAGRRLNPKGGVMPEPQLYDLSTDPAEAKDIAHEHPDKVAELSAKLLELKADAAHRPQSGPPKKEE